MHLKSSTKTIKERENMQISNNMNRFHSPNFGMALKITQKGQKFLENQSMNVLGKIAKTGEEMNDYKFWDLVVDGNGYNIIKKDRLIRYTSPMLEKEADPNKMQFMKSVKIKADRYTSSSQAASHLTFEYPNNDSAIKAYDKFSKLPEEERYIELTRMLEQQSAQIAEDQKFAQKAMEEKQNFVADLFEKFGTKPQEI